MERIGLDQKKKDSIRGVDRELNVISAKIRILYPVSESNKSEAANLEICRSPDSSNFYGIRILSGKEIVKLPRASLGNLEFVEVLDSKEEYIAGSFSCKSSKSCCLSFQLKTYEPFILEFEEDNNLFIVSKLMKCICNLVKNSKVGFEVPKAGRFIALYEPPTASFPKKSNNSKKKKSSFRNILSLSGGDATQSPTTPSEELKKSPFENPIEIPPALPPGKDFYIISYEKWNVKQISEWIQEYVFIEDKETSKAMTLFEYMKKYNLYNEFMRYFKLDQTNTLGKIKLMLNRICYLDNSVSMDNSMDLKGCCNDKNVVDTLIREIGLLDEFNKYYPINFGCVLKKYLFVLEKRKKNNGNFDWNCFFGKLKSQRYLWDVESCIDHVISLLVFEDSIDAFIEKKLVEFRVEKRKEKIEELKNLVTQENENDESKKNSELKKPSKMKNEEIEEFRKKHSDLYRQLLKNRLDLLIEKYYLALNEFPVEFVCCLYCGNIDDVFNDPVGNLKWGDVHFFVRIGKLEFHWSVDSIIEIRYSRTIEKEKSFVEIWSFFL